MTYRKCRKGAALLISIIVLTILSAWAVSIFSISGLNVQLAENQRKANRARACAESGFEAIRYWLSGISVMGTTEPDQIFVLIASSLQSDLTASAISVTYDSSSIIIPAVTLDSAKEQSFSAVLRPLDAETIQVDVTGVYGTISRTIRVNYKFGTRAHTVFNYGVATKGPLSLAGNIELEGVNVSVEASVYIETEGSIDYALSIIGNSQIAGDVSLTNPSPAADIVDLQGGQASIGGETAPEAYDHVSTGVPPTEFPVPDPDYFKELVYDYLNTPESFDGTTFENIIIPPNTNPSFTADTTLKGIIFIETPNVVTFTGHANITGIIVGDGDLNDDSGTNQINFQGTVDSSPVSELPGEAQFDPLHD